MRSPRLAASLVFVTFLGLGSSVACSRGRPADAVACWSDGCLTRAEIVASLDRASVAEPDTAANQRAAIAKELYLAIYETHAARLGLSSDPKIEDRLADWANARLALRWRRHHADMLKPEPELYLGEATHSTVDILFVRGTGNDASQRLAEHLQALAMGSTPAERISLERGLSGSPNGRVDDLALVHVVAEVAAAIRAAGAGGRTPALETPLGTFVIWVHSLSRLAGSDVARSKLAALELEAELVESIREEMGLNADSNADHVLAAAARAEGLADDAFEIALGRQRRWITADLAFEHDRELYVNLDDFRQQIADDPTFYARHHVVLAVVPGRDEDFATQATANRIRDRLLAHRGDKWAVLQNAAEKAAIEYIELADTDTMSLRKVHRDLGPVVAALEPGQWSGPHVMLALRTSQGRIHTGLVFVVLLERRPPTDRELEMLARAALRRHIGSNVDTMLQALTPRWSIEILDPVLVGGFSSQGPP